MKEELLRLEKPIHVKYGEEFEKRVFFITDEIKEFGLTIENNMITGLQVKVDADADIGMITQKMNEVVEKEIATLFIHPANIVWTSDNKREKFYDDVYEKMVEKGIAHECGEGQMSFGDPFFSLMNALDENFKEIAIDKLGGKEYVYPTLISTKALEDCGYFDSFPHMLMFVTRLHNDIEIYNEFFNECKEAGGIDEYAFKYFKNLDYCLPPTMCYHVYDHLRDSEFGSENRIVTAKGKSFRYESKYFKTIERLWDFTIREIVFLGDKDFVLSQREKFMELTFELVDRLGLRGHSEVANDPFFVSPDTASKIFNQRMQKLKYELRLNISKEKTIAAASFNFHEHFFANRFNLRQTADEKIFTGCVGFGIERFAYAFVCQHGLDKNNWPI